VKNAVAFACVIFDCFFYILKNAVAKAIVIF